MSTQDLHPHSDVVEFLKNSNSSMQPAYELASPEEKAKFINRITNKFSKTWKQVQKGMSPLCTLGAEDGAEE